MKNRAIFSIAAALVGISLMTFYAPEVHGAPASNAKPRSFELTGNDQMTFNLERLEVRAGQKVRLKMTNVGKLPKGAMAHNWILLQSGADAMAFDVAAAHAASNEYFPKKLADEVIAHTRLLGSGESDTITFTAPEEPGEYTFLCSFPGHFQAGMKGLLIVS